jgi:undecaprenyl diphosphate synthase
LPDGRRLPMLKKLRTLLGLYRASTPKRIPDINPKPNHVAVIMDGNGRWANAQGLSRVAGHKRGVDSVKSLIKSCIQHDIGYLSIFAFSSENWRRPKAEVDALMDLLGNALETQTKKLNENGVRLKLLGDLTKFSPRIQQLAKQAQAETAHNTKLVFAVAINYGGRWDIAQASRRLAEKVERGEMAAAQVTEEAIAGELMTADMPDPDLFIRTSGEYRISNFLLWQAAYAEFYFTDVLWPDFDEHEFTEALLKYTRRDRRFGGAVDKVTGDQAALADDNNTNTARGEAA